MNKLLQHINLPGTLQYMPDTIGDGWIAVAPFKNFFSIFLRKLFLTFRKFLSNRSYTPQRPPAYATFSLRRPLRSTLKQCRWKKGYRCKSCDPDFQKLLGCKRSLYIKDLYTSPSHEKKDCEQNSVHSRKNYILVKNISIIHTLC